MNHMHEWNSTVHTNLSLQTSLGRLEDIIKTRQTPVRFMRNLRHHFAKLSIRMIVRKNIFIDSCRQPIFVFPNKFFPSNKSPPITPEPYACSILGEITLLLCTQKGRTTSRAFFVGTNIYIE